METGIDGGVKEENIKEIAQTGVNDICIGSAIFNKPDPAAAYRRFVELTI
jgi:ribulose-phosphate 3-epimerase